MKPVKSSALNLLVLLTLLALAAPLQAQTTVSITATDGSAAETAPGQPANPGNIRVTRTGSTAAALTVWVRVKGTAVQGVDYFFANAIGGTITIPAGSASLDISINPRDDALTEDTENVGIDLENNTGNGSPVPYTIGPDDRGEVDILDNEDPNLPPRVVVSIAALPGAAEGTNGTPVPGAFRITRDANLNVDVTVTYAVGGSATPDDDYAALAGSVTIPAGDAFADVVVAPVDDALLEATETVTLTILPSSCPGIFPPPPECYTIGVPASASLVILDNEIPPPPPTVTLVVMQDTNVFGFPAALRGSLSAVAPTGLIASYVVRLDGVVKFSGNTDYPVAPAPGTPFPFSFVLTNLLGGQHQVQATVTDDQGFSAAATRTLFVGAIQPPPPPPATYSITSLDHEAAETLPGEPANSGKFLFVRSGTPGDLELVFYTFTGTARQGVDYTISYGPAIYTTNGVTNGLSQEITINPLDDLFPEGTETVKMQLCFPILRCIEGNCAPVGTSCTGDTPGLNATIHILDNDTSPTPFSVVSVTASDVDAQENSPLSGLPRNPGVFTISRTAPTTNDLTVNYALTPPATTASHVAVNGVDYETLSGEAVIPAGEIAVDVVVNPIYDTWLEGNESVTLTLLPATNAPTNYLLDPGATNDATVVIRDYAPTNIPVVSITVNDSQAIEENVYSRTGSFLVERNGALAESLTVPYAIDGTASNGVDYVALPGFVTIPAGSPRATIIINPIADGVTEPVETVSLTLPPPPLDVFPPTYLFSATGTMHNSAGVSIRDTLLYPGHPFLTKRQRLLQRRFPHRFVIVPLPVAVIMDPSVPPPTGTVATKWAVEASSDLATWEEIGVTTDPEEFVDVNPGEAAQRYYRFREVPPVEP